MVCNRCGIETSDDSPFCTKCGGRSIRTVSTSTTGGAAAAVAPALYQVPRSKPKESELDLAVWVLLPILIVAVWFGATGIRQLGRLSTPSRIQQIANTPVTVKANQHYYYEFNVPSGAKNAMVKGHFSAAGGTGNDVEVSVFSEDEFENWWNGEQSQTIYQSGKVTRSTINARLPADGIYYLLLNNRFSQVSSKVVDIDVALTYDP